MSKRNRPRNHHDSGNGSSGGKEFRIELLNSTQKLAWSTFQKHDVLFLLGPAGSGKTFLATAFAIQSLLRKDVDKIVMTRPIVEAGESLGYLPGDFNEKVNPYMMPIYDCVDKLSGFDAIQKEKIMSKSEVAPLAYMRGRAIINTENLITPNGYKKMGEIKVGDQVIGSDGKPTNVTAVYPQGEIEVYEIGFSDGTKSICCENHLWNTMTLNEKKHNKGYTTKTTKEIMSNVLNKHNQKVHRIPICQPVEFKSQEISIDPYLLGILIGDGHMSDRSLSITTADTQIIEECAKVFPGHDIVYRGKYDYRITSQNKKNLLRESLKELNLCNKKSYEKFVPDVYKFNSIATRLAILQGLLDSDGWICNHKSGKNRIQFCSTSKQLAEDVKFLVRSLGGLAYSRKREFSEKDNHEYNGQIIKHVHSSYVVDIMINMNPFRLARKSAKFQANQTMTKMIKYIIPAGRAEATCITVDAEDELFLTNDFIVTHNTFHNSICIFDEAQNATKSQLKLFLTRFSEGSKLIITGDPRQSDIGSASGLADVVERLRDVEDIGVIEFGNHEIVRHPLIGTILDRLED